MLREWLLQLTELVVPAIDLIALLVITAGTAEAVFRIMAALISNHESEHEVRAVWIRYSRWLVAGLTFQLAADIIETSSTPTWDDIGRIAAIAVIRTFLNFFLERDQREVRELQEESETQKTE
jgi:uncharacterized membrane protein